MQLSFQSSHPIDWTGLRGRNLRIPWCYFKASQQITKEQSCGPPFPFERLRSYDNNELCSTSVTISQNNYYSSSSLFCFTSIFNNKSKLHFHSTHGRYPRALQALTASLKRSSNIQNKEPEIAPFLLWLIAGYNCLDCNSSNKRTQTTLQHHLLPILLPRFRCLIRSPASLYYSASSISVFERLIADYLLSARPSLSTRES